MAKFVVLIYGDAQTWADAPEEWHRQNADKHAAFHAEAGAADRRWPGARADRIGQVSIRAGRGGRPAVTNGPFLETKEVIGGYYVLEAADDDEAIRLAGLIPEATAAARRRRGPPVAAG